MFSTLRNLSIFILIVGVVAYFAAQRKVDKDIQLELAKFASLGSVTYDKSSIDLNGTIRIEKPRIFINVMQLAIEADEISWSFGNLYQTAMADTNFKAGEFPEKINYKISRLSFPLDEFADQFPKVPVSSVDLINSAACGDIRQFSPKEIVDLGYDTLVTSLNMEVEQLQNGKEIAVNLNLSVEGANKVDMDILIDLQKAKQSALKGDSLDSIKKMKVLVFDEGYNTLQANYCARQANIKIDEFLDLHVETIKSMMEEADLQPSENLIAAYKNYKQPGSSMVVEIKPQNNIRVGDLAFYDSATIQNMLKLKVSVNGREVNEFFNNWQLEKFNQIAARQSEFVLAPRHQIPPKQALTNRRMPVSQESNPENTQQAGRANQNQRVDGYTVLSLDDAEKHIGKEVIAVRTVGKEYRGALVKVQDRRMWISVSQSGGQMTLPLDFSAIDEFSVKLN